MIIYHRGPEASESVIIKVLTIGQNTSPEINFNAEPIYQNEIVKLFDRLY